MKRKCVSAIRQYFAPTGEPQCCECRRTLTPETKIVEQVPTYYIGQDFQRVPTTTPEVRCIYCDWLVTKTKELNARRRMFPEVFDNERYYAECSAVYAEFARRFPGIDSQNLAPAKVG